MLDYSFIRLNTDLEKALELQESPIVSHYYYGQVQLKPLDPKPYFQTTNNSEGVTLGSNVQAFLVNCSDQEEEITAHFEYENLIDADNISQIIFRLAYLPTDYYGELVYLKITSSTNTYYSNRFSVSSIDTDLTSRIDYYDPRNLSASATDPIFTNTLEAVRIGFYFFNHIDQDELKVNYQITTSQNVTSRVDVADLKQWIFPMADSWTWRRLKRSFYNGRCYVDFTRNYPTEAFEYEGREERSNINENYFTTDPNENDTITVDDVIIIPNEISFAYDLTIQF